MSSALEVVTGQYAARMRMVEPLLPQSKRSFGAVSFWPPENVILSG
jgi:hypothetical protein